MIFISLILLVVSYALGLMALFFSWRKIKVYPDALTACPLVSVVIAFRNEVEHLPFLLQALAEQDYPSEHLEIILVNDHSDDRFEEIIKDYKGDFKLHLLSLSAGEYGKKKALKVGIGAAQGTWIMTSDADCVFGNMWVKTMMSHALQSNARFVFGPVAYPKRGSFLFDFQAVELSSLIGSGAALWQMNYPTMCNGANLLYKKVLVSGQDLYLHNAHLASGDDEFLMHEVFKGNPQDVSFVKDQSAVVLTEACSSWSGFFQQRKRWASKWGGYQLIHVKVIAFMVFLWNTCYALLPFLILVDQKLTLWILIAYSIRIILDGIFLLEINRFYHKPFNLVSYLGIAMVYPYYVVVSALAGRFGKYTWKGRSVN